MTSSSYDQKTAYDSTRIKPQAPAKKKGVWQKLLARGQRVLPFTHTDESIPKALYEERKPSELAREREDKKDLAPYWNHENMTMGTMSAWANVYLLFSALGGGGYTLPLWLFLF